MASLIRAELARLLLTEVSDPRLQHLVITEVELTRDLRQARVFFECGPSTDEKEVTRGLSKAVVFLRRRLGASLELKYVPELSFVSDKHASQVNRVLSLLEEVQKKEAADHE